MSSFKRTGILLVLALVVAASAWAQWGGKGKGGTQAPTPSVVNAVVGSGAEYQMSVGGKESDVAYAIVGKEDVNGNAAIWFEMRVQSAEMGGEVVTKMLTVTSGPEQGLKRMITQMPGQAPQEMPGFLMKMTKQNQPSSGKPDYGELVGTETVTVPAGTFLCQHYRKQQTSGQVDCWVAPEVASVGWVKMTSPNTTLLLKKILSNESSHIKGEPQKMPAMPHF
jgi:hypothetical protein